MTLALRLARFGIRCALVDPLGNRVDPGSKALLMAREAMEVLGRVGAGSEILERAVVLRSARTFYRDVELFARRFEHDGAGYPPMLNFPQADTERVLLRRVEAEPLVERLWGASVVALEQDEEAVKARLDDGTLVRADYAAGCDGVRSTVRKQLGLDFAGRGFSDRFLITDIRAELPFPRDERQFFFDPPFNPGRTVLVHPQPEASWHVDWQVGQDVDAEEERRSGRLDERLRRLVGDMPYELLWVTAYRFLQLIADRFSHGRVFLLGDAAHVYSPYGARGLNSGLADADNLGWKLWLVLGGRAPTRLLDTYDGERRPAAAENLRITGASARFMAPPSRRRRLYRDAVLAAAARVPRLRRFVDSGRFYAPHVYRHSPIVGVGGGDLLHSVAGEEFVALVPAAAAGPAEAALRDARVPCRVVAAPTEQLVLVRPDGHVAPRHDPRDVEALAPALARAVAA
jgi:3-(3-hydroxy-phenyl)propionate hydroxylase